MLHRTALFVASLAAALALAAGLSLAGFAPTAPSAAPAPAASIDPAALTADAPAAPTVQVDTVYLAPVVKPKEVTVHKVVKSSAHGDDSGEGNDD